MKSFLVSCADGVERRFTPRGNNYTGTAIDAYDYTYGFVRVSGKTVGGYVSPYTKRFIAFRGGKNQHLITYTPKRITFTDSGTAQQLGC